MWATRISNLQARLAPGKFLLISIPVDKTFGSVPVDFLCPKFRVVHTKHDVISILINKYT